MAVCVCYRTAGDVLRNFGARGVTGIRGAYERLIKVGYGLSILGTVPLVVLPFQDSIGPVISAWTKPWSRGADKKADVGSEGPAQRSHLQEQFIATLILSMFQTHTEPCCHALSHRLP